jgi:hypothetical protein
MAIPGMQPKGAQFAFIDPTGKHRSLTSDEMHDLRDAAEEHVPLFHPPHNAAWDDHHPIAREVWEKKGITKEKADAQRQKVADLHKQLAEAETTPA